MKIHGDVNIMGMKEVIFRDIDHDLIVTYQKEDPGSEHEGEWFRLERDINPEHMLYRSNEDIMSTIKALALNPNVELTFNDGAMYVDFKIKKYKLTWGRH